MENNKKTQYIWIGVIAVVVIGLVLINQKSGTETTDYTQDYSSTQNSGVTVPKTTAPAAKKTGTLVTPIAKPTGNIVELTDTGFKPAIIQVKSGESVEFLNSSGKAMIIRSYDKKPANFYPGFSQESGPLGRGGKFFFAFTVKGDWSYYNLNGENKDAGVVSVR